MSSSTTPLCHTPARGTPANIRIHLIYFQKLESLAYTFLSLIVWVYLHSNLCSRLQKTSFLQQSAYWPFKMLQGRPRSIILVPIESAYATSYESVVVTMVLSCIVSQIQRLSDLLGKSCLFLLPLSHSVHPLPMFALEFRGEVNHEETRVM